MNQQIDALRALLTSPQKVVITMHRDPDADAMGSSLGWALYLEAKGHSVNVISPTDIAPNLMWMPTAGRVLTYEGNKSKPKVCRELIQDATLVCCLDFSALSRLKELGRWVNEAQGAKLLVDHHIEPETFADIMVWDTEAAATAQLIYKIVSEIDGPDFFDVPMAECLYAGIMTDTGSFRHGNTTPEVHLAVADLMRTGFEVNKVHRMIFDNSPLLRMKLVGHVLSEKLHVLPEYRTAYMTLTATELEKYKSGAGDTDGIVNYGLQVEDVVMSVLFIERKGEVKISFRSFGEFSVRDLANAHFNGGGHRNASGGRTTMSLDDTVEQFLKFLPFYKSQLLSVEK
ncbi:DHH family phosphoesterase [Persicitalea jodogahamensis]|uniref:Exopolyphosphatase n=1 Tax=Persicitalea jodogahamensis TaxID=402147 RepID=A0A8J3DAQ4_9BACT|nr:bifunctional oligoribonuclease/PAP phosphatase NrnA [Persicitalea jodogahamensis]GHB76785.1 exopolyphosphatase [Persicitalea jodogahamensis]